MRNRINPHPCEVPAFFENRERLVKVERVLKVIGVHDPQEKRYVSRKYEGRVGYLMITVDLSDDPIPLDFGAEVYDPDSCIDRLEYAVGWETVQACEELLLKVADIADLVERLADLDEEVDQ